MGLPQPMIDAIRSLEQAEEFQSGERLREATEVTLRERQSAFRGLLRDFEKGLEEIKESGRAYLQKTEQEISSGSPPQELDQAIDWLLEREEELRRKLSAAMEQVRSLQADVFSSRISAADKASLLSAFERFEKAWLGVLATLRDLRWNLMALRAEAEDPGDAPVFDNPQDLLGYLKTPPK
jgi:hypothetical protein